MKSLLAVIVGLAAILLSWQAVAQIVFYEQEGLRGRSFAANGRIDNFENIGFNDRASSVVVQHVSWESAKMHIIAVAALRYGRGNIRPCARWT